MMLKPLFIILCFEGAGMLMGATLMHPNWSTILAIVPLTILGGFALGSMEKK